MHTAPIGLFIDEAKARKVTKPTKRKGSRLTSTWNFHPVWPTCATSWLPYIFYTTFDPGDQTELRGRRQERKEHIHHRDAYPHFSFLKSTHNRDFNSRILALYISQLTLPKPSGEKWITRGDRIVFPGKLLCSSLSLWSYVPMVTWWMPFHSL